MKTLTEKYLSVYTFGDKKADGNREMKNLLGGFTITTEICTQYNQEGKNAVIKRIENDVRNAIEQIEQTMGTVFGDDDNPLLLSVRSGARVSMPGMMDTVLNLGLNDNSIKGVIAKTKNERFAWDSYRRFIQMYSGVVLGLKPESKEDLDPFEEIIENLKEKRGISLDTEFTIQDLQDLVFDFKEIVKKRSGKSFPTDPPGPAQRRQN